MQCTGTAIPKKKEEIVYYEECMNTALLHCSCSSVDFSLLVSFRSNILYIFVHLPLAMYIATFYSRSISIWYGSLLRAVAMGLNIPLQVTGRPTHGNEIGQPLDSYLSVHCMRFVWFECGE